MTVDAQRERWQEPSGSRSREQGQREQGWREAHRLHIRSLQGMDAEFIIEIERIPAAGRVEFRTAVIAPDAPIVGIVETRIVAPAHGWEIRTSGLWADHICEVPLVHWTYGLEAFAIAVDEPSELTESGYGDRVPLGWELDFEATSDATWRTPELHYAQSGRAHGIVLGQDGDTEIEGEATRHHWWGDDPRSGPQPFDRALAAAAAAL